jgi:hypothetical protein
MTVTESAVSEILKFGGQALIVALGWFVVHKLSIKRDTDKARREMVAKAADGLSDLTDQIFAMSIKYHMTADRDSASEASVLMKLSDLGCRLGSLASLVSEGSVLEECTHAVVGLRQAVTKQNFQDQHEAALTMESQTIQMISATVIKVKQVFLELKHSQFPSS